MSDPAARPSADLALEDPLGGRTLWIPQMGRGGSRAFAAAVRGAGIEARACPDSDDRSFALASRQTSGDECLPARVTLGAFLALAERPGFVPDEHAFFMPTADGPCRFGQYAPHLRQVLDDVGLGTVVVLAPSSRDGYRGFGGRAGEVLRSGYRALVAADVLRGLLHRSRPYERSPGDADAVHARALAALERVLETRDVPAGRRLRRIEAVVGAARDEYRRLATRPAGDQLLIGVVGEIFCRLTPFANESIVRSIESLGGEVVLAPLGEWIAYTNVEVQARIRRQGRQWSRAMALARLTEAVQRHDRWRLHRLVRADLHGREEPSVRRVLRDGRPYLPHTAALGEMALSVGKAVFHHRQGCDGVADVSPFTCMNGIVTEAVYPRVSADLDGIPIKNFFVDRAHGHLHRDLEIFMELARSYRARVSGGARRLGRRRGGA